jgi:hypothetical protein
MPMDCRLDAKDSHQHLLPTRKEAETQRLSKSRPAAAPCQSIQTNDVEDALRREPELETAGTLQRLLES